MSSAAHGGGEDRVELEVLQNFAEALSHARTVQQVYAFGLNAIHELFTPVHAFITLGESEPVRFAPGPLSDVVIPIPAREQPAGRFVFQYHTPRTFTESDVALAGLIATQCAAFIDAI